MRGMLYDMIHTGIYGTISLFACGFALLYYALLCGIAFFYNHFHKKFNLAGIKRFQEKNGNTRKIHLKIIFGFLALGAVMFVLFLFKEWKVKEQDYDYIRTEMGEEISLDSLFLDEPQVELEDDEDLRKLHIKMESPMTEITKIEIDKRVDVFSTVYQEPDTESRKSTETKEFQGNGLEINGVKSEEFRNYLNEYEEWNAAFADSGLSSDLYQSSRAARDMLEVGRSECSDDELLAIGAEAVYRSERFLEYGNWNVNTEEAPVIVERKDVLFLNSKVFYQLYQESEIRAELKMYSNEFLINAYVCMFLAEEVVSKEDVEYAEVNYYLGNIGEKMLGKVSKEDSFYKDTKEDSLKYYNEALSCLRNKPDYYDKESNMENNCRKGITTLKNS